MILKKFNLLKNLFFFDNNIFNMVFLGKLYINHDFLKIHKRGRIAPGERESTSKGYHQILLKISIYGRTNTVNISLV